MLVTTLQLKVVLTVVRLRSPRARSIEVLLQCEEVGLTCQLSMIFALAHSRVIARKYHSLGMSPYGKNLTIISMSNICVKQSIEQYCY
jgi:hypothetical protein